MINFYRDTWKRRAYHLAPIMLLTKNKKKGSIVWSAEAEAAFENIKKICAEDVMLYCPDFNKDFKIHTICSDYQIGAIISQNGRPVAYWSKNLSDTQKKCPTTDQ